MNDIAWPEPRRLPADQRTRLLALEHRTYERRGSEKLADLAVYCDTCHQRLHQAA